ncbi:hypothetical protein VNO78_09442 [Psophocarpus tetragonolobus]|uniref:Phytosulfokine n=1 Tax=Psophocarpus tetragonolobus TaxID=3891 RepID=A0AAN9SZ86_PSOTE
MYTRHLYRSTVTQDRGVARIKRVSSWVEHIEFFGMSLGLSKLDLPEQLASHDKNIKNSQERWKEQTSSHFSLLNAIVGINLMARCITMLFIISVLLFSVAESRSLFKSISQDSVSHEKTQLNDDGGACNGLDRTECVVKTTMVAHTDYVYTQDTNNGP